MGRRLGGGGGGRVRAVQQGGVRSLRSRAAGQLNCGAPESRCQEHPAEKHLTSTTYAGVFSRDSSGRCIWRMAWALTPNEIATNRQGCIGTKHGIRSKSSKMGQPTKQARQSSLVCRSMRLSSKRLKTEWTNAQRRTRRPAIAIRLWSQLHRAQPRRRHARTLTAHPFARNKYRDMGVLRQSHLVEDPSEILATVGRHKDNRAS